MRRESERVLEKNVCERCVFALIIFLRALPARGFSIRILQFGFIWLYGARPPLKVLAKNF
jgi:hypothetical protein